MTLADLCRSNARMRYTHGALFRWTFGVSLDRFWDNLTGFDIVAFDEQVVRPEANESTAEAIERKWGAEARALAQGLVHGPAA